VREFLKIVAFCVLASIVYGIVHDQITIRVCPAYLTVFHPHIVNSASLTVIALAWGVVATWWAGLISGVLIALSARTGREPRLALSDLWQPMFCLLGSMATAALVWGFFGHHVAVSTGGAYPYSPFTGMNSDEYPGLMTAWYAHTASYAVGFAGSLVLCVFNVVRRLRRGTRTFAAAGGA